MAIYGLGFALFGAILLYMIRNKEEKTLLIRYMATLLNLMPTLLLPIMTNTGLTGIVVLLEKMQTTSSSVTQVILIGLLVMLAVSMRMVLQQTVVPLQVTI